MLQLFYNELLPVAWILFMHKIYKFPIKNQVRSEWIK